MRYNQHAARGQRKGKFTKVKVIHATEKLVERCKERRLNKKPNTFAVKVEYQVIDGRRIIDMNAVDAELWCNPCNQALSLRYVVKQKAQGLVDIYYTQCHNCLSIYEISTSKSSSCFYDTIAIAMLDAGVGETKINTILSCLNIPTVYSTSLKRWERFEGKPIDELAQESCIDVIKEERRLTLESIKDKIEIW